MESPPHSTQLPPAGWYPDPEGSELRWWDGQRWTERRAPVQPPEPQPDLPPPALEPITPSYPQAPPGPPAQPLSFGAKALIVIVVLALVGGILKIGGCSLGSSDVTVIDHKCIPNPDGSVHIQGQLRNDGSTDETAIIEFTLTLSGGETESSKPFGGYSVPAGEMSLVGEDLNVPPGSEWVDCNVEVVG